MKLTDIKPPKPTCKKRLSAFLARNLPHKTKSGNSWCIPMWLVWITGGTFDTGNGYGWRPNIFRHIRRYYKQDWKKAGYSLREWIFG